MRALLSATLAAVSLLPSAAAPPQARTAQSAGGQGRKGTATARSGDAAGYAVAPVVLKDEDCARDYANAFKAGGVSTRKQIADLLQYGCAERGVGVYKGISLEHKKVTQTATFRRVSLVCISGCGDRPILKGWVAETDFHPGTEEEIRKALAAILRE